MRRLFSVAALMGMFSSSIGQINQPSDINSEIQLNTITTAVPFLQIAPDSRASGIGDAGLGFSPDANQMHWNPSNLAFGQDKLQIGLSYSPWLRELVGDMNLAYLAAYGKLNDKQAIGGSVRYFALGNIQFTDQTGAETMSFNPNEVAVDFTFAQKLGTRWSGAMSARYIASNLTGSLNVGGVDTQVGQSFAVDLSMTYFNDDVELGGKDLDIIAGWTISNIGTKMAYTETADRDFLPTNLRLGSGFNLHLDDYNELSWNININKLLVPTPPIYAKDENGQPVFDSEGNQVIAAGKDPNVGVAQGMVQSFYDAPNGFKEEMQEINFSTGFEYWYDRQFAFRAGYFYEHPNKGARQFLTLGVGLRFNIFALDFSYLIATTQRNPLANTLRFSLMFTFDDLRGNKGGDDLD
jgi:hypothetical protein